MRNVMLASAFHGSGRHDAAFLAMRTSKIVCTEGLHNTLHFKGTFSFSSSMVSSAARYKRELLVVNFSALESLVQLQEIILNSA